MSKYRPAVLPTGNAVGATADSAIPPVRSRAEIRKEWEQRNAAEAMQSGGNASDSSLDPAVPVGLTPAPRVGEVGQSVSISADAPVVAAGDGVEQAEGPGSEAAAELVVPAETGGIEGAATSGSDPETPSTDEAIGELVLSEADDGLVNLPANRDENGFVAMPLFTEPQGTDPRERLDHYARSYVAAEYAARANVQRATQQKIIIQGLSLLRMKEERLWEVLNLRDFDALVKFRFGIRKNYADKIIRSMPVVRALETHTTMEMAEKHLRPLVPVHELHGAEAVQATWDEALRKGKITERSLKEAAHFLGFGEPPMQEAGRNQGSSNRGVNSGTTAPDFDRATEVVGASIRMLMETDSAQARRQALELRKLAHQLCDELGIAGDAEAS